MMNRTHINNQRARVFQALYSATSQTEILEQFKEELLTFKTIKNDDDFKKDEASRIFSKYVLAITYLYSLPSIKNNLKAYKKVISEVRAGNDISKNFYFEGLYGTVTKSSEQNKEKRKTTDEELPIDVISEIKRVRKILELDKFNLKKNQNHAQVRSYHLAYILGLSTGRRFTELLKSIKIHKKNNDYVFIGLLKKKDELKNQQLKAYFLELSPLEARKYLQEFRDFLNNKLQKDKNISLDDLTESQINTTFSKVYNNAVTKISNKKVPNFHELRKFYTITFQDIYLEQNPHLKDNSEQELSVILQDVRYTILGHEIKNDTTSTYVTFK